MNRSKLLRLSIQLANSLSSTRHPRLSSTQVTRLNPNLTHESIIYILMNLNTNPQKSLDFFKWVCVKKGFNPSFSGYFVLLRVLACQDFTDEFWNVFLEIKKKGFYIDLKSYSTIYIAFTRNKLVKESAEWTKMYNEMLENDVEKEFVNEVLMLILSSGWSDDVEGLLRNKLEFPLTEKFVLRVIAELWEQPLKALRFFEWIGSVGGYKHDIVTYNGMAQVLAHESSVVEFWEFVKRMRVGGYELDMLTYVRCSRNLPIKDAVELLEFMMDGPYHPSLHHSTALMGRIARESEPHLDLVYKVFNKLVGAGVAPTVSLYDGVHLTLCKLGRFDEANNVVEKLRNLGHKPENRTYSQVISGLCKHGKLDEACKIIDQMEVEGCVPNAKTWMMLIEGHCEANHTDLALSCFAKMKEKNVDYDPRTFSVLIKGFISENKVLDAYRYFTEYVEDEGHVKPARETYNFLIEKLAEAGNLEEAILLLSTMKKQQYSMYPHPITQYISKFGTVDDAKKLLTAMSNNCVAYQKVIGAFREQGRYSEAKELHLSSPLHVRNNKAILAMFDSPEASVPKEALG